MNYNLFRAGAVAAILLAAAGCTTNGVGPSQQTFDSVEVASALAPLPFGLRNESQVRLNNENGDRITFGIRAKNGQWVGVERNVFPLKVEGQSISFDTRIKPPGKQRSLSLRLLPNGRAEVLAGSVRNWTWTITRR